MRPGIGLAVLALAAILASDATTAQSVNGTMGSFDWYNVSYDRFQIAAPGASTLTLAWLGDLVIGQEIQNAVVTLRQLFVRNSVVIESAVTSSTIIFEDCQLGTAAAPLGVNFKGTITNSTIKFVNTSVAAVVSSEQTLGVIQFRSSVVTSNITAYNCSFAASLIFPFFGGLISFSSSFGTASTLQVISSSAVQRSSVLIGAVAYFTSSLAGANVFIANSTWDHQATAPTIATSVVYVAGSIMDGARISVDQNNVTVYLPIPDEYSSASLVPCAVVRVVDSITGPTAGVAISSTTFRSTGFPPALMIIHGLVSMQAFLTVTDVTIEAVGPKTLAAAFVVLSKAAVSHSVALGMSGTIFTARDASPALVVLLEIDGALQSSTVALYNNVIQSNAPNCARVLVIGSQAMSSGVASLSSATTVAVTGLTVSCANVIANTALISIDGPIRDDSTVAFNGANIDVVVARSTTTATVDILRVCGDVFGLQSAVSITNAAVRAVAISSGAVIRALTLFTSPLLSASDQTATELGSLTVVDSAIAIGTNATGLVNDSAAIRISTNRFSRALIGRNTITVAGAVPETDCVTVAADVVNMNSRVTIDTNVISLTPSNAFAARQQQEKQNQIGYAIRLYSLLTSTSPLPAPQGSIDVAGNRVSIAWPAVTKQDAQRFSCVLITASLAAQLNVVTNVFSAYISNRTTFFPSAVTFAGAFSPDVVSASTLFWAIRSNVATVTLRDDATGASTSTAVYPVAFDAVPCGAYLPCQIRFDTNVVNAEAFFVANSTAATSFTASSLCDYVNGALLSDATGSSLTSIAPCTNTPPPNLPPQPDVTVVPTPVPQGVVTPAPPATPAPTLPTDVSGIVRRRDVVARYFVVQNAEDVILTNFTVGTLIFRGSMIGAKIRLTGGRFGQVLFQDGVSLGAITVLSSIIGDPQWAPPSPLFGFAGVMNATAINMILTANATMMQTAIQFDNDIIGGTTITIGGSNFNTTCADALRCPTTGITTIAFNRTVPTLTVSNSNIWFDAAVGYQFLKTAALDASNVLMTGIVMSGRIVVSPAALFATDRFTATTLTVTNNTISWIDATAADTNTTTTAAASDPAWAVVAVTNIDAVGTATITASGNRFLSSARRSTWILVHVEAAETLPAAVTPTVAITVTSNDMYYAPDAMFVALLSSRGDALASRNAHVSVSSNTVAPNNDESVPHAPNVVAVMAWWPGALAGNVSITSNRYVSASRANCTLFAVSRAFSSVTVIVSYNMITCLGSLTAPAIDARRLQLRSDAQLLVTNNIIKATITIDAASSSLGADPVIPSAIRLMMAAVHMNIDMDPGTFVAFSSNVATVIASPGAGPVAAILLRLVDRGVINLVADGNSAFVSHAAGGSYAIAVDTAALAPSTVQQRVIRASFFSVAANISCSSSGVCTGVQVPMFNGASMVPGVLAMSLATNVSCDADASDCVPYGAHVEILIAQGDTSIQSVTIGPLVAFASFSNGSRANNGSALVVVNASRSAPIPTLSIESAVIEAVGPEPEVMANVVGILLVRGVTVINVAIRGVSARARDTSASSAAAAAFPLLAGVAFTSPVEAASGMLPVGTLSVADCDVWGDAGVVDAGSAIPAFAFAESTCNRLNGRYVMPGDLPSPPWKVWRCPLLPRTVSRTGHTDTVSPSKSAQSWSGSITSVTGTATARASFTHSVAGLSHTATTSASESMTLTVSEPETKTPTKKIPPTPVPPPTFPVATAAPLITRAPTTTAPPPTPPPTPSSIATTTTTTATPLATTTTASSVAVSTTATASGNATLPTPTTATTTTAPSVTVPTTASVTSGRTTSTNPTNTTTGPVTATTTTDTTVPTPAPDETTLASTVAFTTAPATTAAAVSTVAPTFGTSLFTFTMTLSGNYYSSVLNSPSHTAALSDVLKKELAVLLGIFVWQIYGLQLTKGSLVIVAAVGASGNATADAAAASMANSALTSVVGSSAAFKGTIAMYQSVSSSSEIVVVMTAALTSVGGTTAPPTPAPQIDNGGGGSASACGSLCVGLIVGGVLIALLLVTVVIFAVRRHRKSTKARQDEKAKLDKDARAARGDFDVVVGADSKDDKAWIRDNERFHHPEVEAEMTEKPKPSVPMAVGAPSGVVGPHVPAPTPSPPVASGVPPPMAQPRHRHLNDLDALLSREAAGAAIPPPQAGATATTNPTATTLMTEALEQGIASPAVVEKDSTAPEDDDHEVILAIGARDEVVEPPLGEPRNATLPIGGSADVEAGSGTRPPSSNITGGGGGGGIFRPMSAAVSVDHEKPAATTGGGASSADSQVNTTPALSEGFAITRPPTAVDRSPSAFALPPPTAANTGDAAAVAEDQFQLVSSTLQPQPCVAEQRPAAAALFDDDDGAEGTGTAKGVTPVAAPPTAGVEEDDSPRTPPPAEQVAAAPQVLQSDFHDDEVDRPVPVDLVASPPAFVNADVGARDDEANVGGFTQTPPRDHSPTPQQQAAPANGDDDGFAALDRPSSAAAMPEATAAAAAALLIPHEDDLSTTVPTTAAAKTKGKRKPKKVKADAQPVDVAPDIRLDGPVGDEPSTAEAVQEQPASPAVLSTEEPLSPAPDSGTVQQQQQGLQEADTAAPTAVATDQRRRSGKAQPRRAVDPFAGLDLPTAPSHTAGGGGDDVPPTSPAAPAAPAAGDDVLPTSPAALPEATLLPSSEERRSTRRRQPPAGASRRMAFTASTHMDPSCEPPPAGLHDDAAPEE